MKSLLPKKKKEEPKEEFFKPKVTKLLANKTFKIVHNNYVREIKEGDDLSDIPEMYLENLRTEGIIE